MQAPIIIKLDEEECSKIKKQKNSLESKNKGWFVLYYTFYAFLAVWLFLTAINIDIIMNSTNLSQKITKAR